MTINHLPINRIIYTLTFTKKDLRRKLNNLLQNPNFNQFEYLKHVKIDNKNLTCLANKTIHIVDFTFQFYN